MSPAVFVRACSHQCLVSTSSFDYNRLESAFLITAQLMLLSGMIFQSAAFPVGSTGYQILVVALMSLLSVATLSFTFALTFEIYRSVRFSAVLERARKLEAAAHADTRAAKVLARMMQGRGDSTGHDDDGRLGPRSQRSWRNILQDVDEQFAERPRSGTRSDADGKQHMLFNPLHVSSPKSGGDVKDSLADVDKLLGRRTARSGTRSGVRGSVHMAANPLAGIGGLKSRVKAKRVARAGRRISRRAGASGGSGGRRRRSRKSHAHTLRDDAADGGAEQGPE